MSIRRFRGLITGTFLFALSVSVSHAAPIELITNGGFETGDFTGWSTSNTGLSFGFAINDGTLDPAGNGTPTAPISGNFDAVSSQTGAGQNNLFQQMINLPGSFSSLTLSWSDRIENFAGTFSDPNQEFRVLLVDGLGGLISEVFSTDPGDALIQIGPNNRSFDVTALLSPFAGQAIGLRFEQQDNLFFFNATVDNVSLQAVPEPATITMLGLALAGLGFARKRKV